MKQTEHRMTILVWLHEKTYIMYKDKHVIYDETAPINTIDDTIRRIEEGIGGGCIWRNGKYLVMDMEHPQIIADNKKYGFDDNLRIDLGWDIEIIELEPSIVTTQEINRNVQ